MACLEPCQVDLEPGSGGRNEPDASTPEPTVGEGQGAKARPVRPLEVVDGHERRSRVGKPPEDAERREGHRCRIDDRPRLAPAQGLLQCGSLRRRQLGERADVDLLEEVGEHRERELLLRLGRPGGEDVVASSP